MSKRFPIDDYRDAVWDSDLPTSTKFVALAMAKFMNYRTLGDYDLSVAIASFPVCPVHFTDVNRCGVTRQGNRAR